MKAKIITGSNPNNDRINLGEMLPLKAPLSTVICPVYACNFKCRYCIHGQSKEERAYITSQTLMDFELYKKFVYGIKELNQPLRRLSFAGMGEPLLHKQIADMVALAKTEQIANTVEITSNGSCLNQELTDKLISARLDMIRISIQGTTNQKYQEVSNVSFHIDNLIKELKYFYDRKEETKIYVKIIDCALEGDADKEIFYQQFGDVCDMIGIESLIENARDAEYEELRQDKKMDRNLFGNEIVSSEICPQPFFTMMISPGGEISPCCSMSTPLVVGDLKESTIGEIWNGDVLKKMRFHMLTNRSENGSLCATCSYYRYMMYKEDILDEYKNKLLEHYKD